jgi:hypothetical protein
MGYVMVESSEIFLRVWINFACSSLRTLPIDGSDCADTWKKSNNNKNKEDK